ncbi:MAG: GNAT family N-acetyltransferase [Candidatus Marinimicrobia bacterium]|nr:GNAT family N-acetyltransferase [Candidatus Neomarinimicrobiota bacterium]
MEFLKLDKNDQEFVLKQLKEAAVWLKEQNIDYWQNWHNPSELHKNWIKEGLDKGQFYRVYDSDKLIGIFRLQYSDELFWGEHNDKAGYIHSFTTSRKMSGQDLGYKILDEITTLLRRKDCDYLRLDCGIKNKKLVEYYKNYGFEEAGTVEVHQECLQLLEKEI